MQLEKTDRKKKNQSKRLRLEKKQTEKYKRPEQEVATGKKKQTKKNQSRRSRLEKRGGKKKTAQGLSE